MYCCVTGSENEMKKLFTADDFMVAFISALGYGFGETIARISGWSELMCIAASFAVGIVLEEIIGGIVFSKAVQKNMNRRMLTFAAILLVFLLGQYISVKWMGTSLAEYLQEELLFVVGLPMIGFVVNLLLRGYRAWKIRKVYGDGSRGYVFDLKEEDIEETNRENRPITGEYDAELAVKTRTGIFVGEKQKKIIHYLGIPYAEPPVGELRWRAPVSLPASDAVFEAKNFGASAIQVEHEGSILKKHRQSEDCLSLNICIGSKKAEGKRPVLVLFHHGDFTFGGTADPLMYGADYINDHQDIVFVSFNYRLGIFGFIDFSEVPGGDAYPDAANLGLLDQVAALEWIRENISAFGGDPDRITVLGFDAGATSILMLASCGRAKGLFQKAFVFNGNLATAYDSPDGSRALAGNLLKETQTSTMEELLKLDTKTLKDAAQRLWQDMCAPTCDGNWIPVDVDQAYRDKAASGIEFIIGIPADETGVLRSFLGRKKFDDFVSSGMTVIRQYADDSLAGEIREFMETQKKLSGESEARAKLIEQWLAIREYRSAARLSEGGNKVRLLYWNEKALIEKLGTGTVDAAASLLGNEDALQMYGSVIHQDLAEILQKLLEKFVNGDTLQLYPNEIGGVDAIDWKAFPRALVVSDDRLYCETIEDRLTEVKGLLDFMVR